MELTPAIVKLGQRVVVRRPKPGCPPAGTRGTIKGIMGTLGHTPTVVVMWHGMTDAATYQELNGRRYYFGCTYYINQFDVEATGFDLIDEGF